MNLHNNSYILIYLKQPTKNLLGTLLNYNFISLSVSSVCSQNSKRPNTRKLTSYMSD
jgi:hypothetical protein